MHEDTLQIADAEGRKRSVPFFPVHTLVIGSGAAGLNAAIQLRAAGVDDVLILTEGLDLGTSVNTGSDKQTYYKLSLCGAEEDSPLTMAKTYFAGGGMHGDLALVEAALSTRAFMHLVNLGVPFPRDAYGQFVGYKTDHDPRQRATSVGPYTSREMCRVLIRRVRELGIPVREGRQAVKLLTIGAAGALRAAGAVAIADDGQLEVYGAENVIFAVGGPGGLYRTSVYPEVHTGAIGVALLAGAAARGLPESQYGLASTRFRWNVSGTYMQVIPRFVSTAADGASDAREFLRESFATPGEMNSRVFLKGYQWPFDARKAIGGSSLVDILVYIETVTRGRRVFLDFRGNPEAFRVDELSAEARTYLEKSRALQATPLARLRAMNPGAIELYAEHGIDLSREPLEIAVCAQHNNGGLAANAWWESENVRHLFPLGEVNGSHGIYRPGGAALNAGQVGGFRAAEFIAHRYIDRSLTSEALWAVAAQAAGEVAAWLDRCGVAAKPWPAEREELQARMSRAGAHVREAGALDRAVAEAREQWRRIEAAGGGAARGREAAERLRNRQLCFAHLVYLDAVRAAVGHGVGSRGSAIVLDPAGERVHDILPAEWRVAPEQASFRTQVMETAAAADAKISHRWVPVRPIPQEDLWFETAWARFREGAIYGP